LAVLEHWARFEYLATVEILDGREWKRLRVTLAAIRGLVYNRIVEIISAYFYCKRLFITFLTIFLSSM